MRHIALVFASISLVMFGCWNMDSLEGVDGGGDSDADSDTDTDTDTGTDSDSDTDLDKDTDADAGNDAGGYTDPNSMEYLIDDGTWDIPVGFAEKKRDYWWANRFDVVTGGEVITHVKVALGYDVPIGAPFTVIVYDDNNNDGIPGNSSDLVLLASEEATVTQVPPDTNPAFFEIVALSSPPTVSGSFFVAVLFTQRPTAGEEMYPAMLDRATPPAGESWETAALPGGLDTANVKGTCFWRTIVKNREGNWLLRAFGTAGI